ncbi:nucleotidyl transferase AbiEii/AbiGii toxin family protein [Rothia halotolerans]|uniref:nucleotidyl transferase AbiEii/AbiGii toxin family protein n=1 Tax=Rothia halotolerans TaxID=405770 RepID=UPI00101DD39A|nr:nucleotidyl transferase AbiEii/AbiGii toxin family protein [Rothia halotolerans]
MASSDRERDLRFQRQVTHLLLEQLQAQGFVLTGSGALREHGLIDRPTKDVDMFTEMSSAQTFVPATKRAVEMLRAAGYDVEVGRDFPTYKSIGVSRGDQRLEVDFGLDYRGHQPVRMEIGPVLALDDAIGSKVSALYSRGYPRVFLDVDAIRQTGRFTDGHLLQAGQAQDPGLDRRLFGELLQDVYKIRLGEVLPYGITEEQLENIKRRMGAWGEELSG